MLKSYKTVHKAPVVSLIPRPFTLPYLFCLLTLLTTTAAAVHSQALPPIRNFTPQQYGADNQNWAVTQAADGWMYFANNGGLLEYNGVRWNRYAVPNGSVLRSVYAQGTRVYSGCYMEFGYWERNAQGKQEYTSLSASMQDTLLTDEEFWKIRGIGDWILFQSLQRIYAYNKRDAAFTILPAVASRAQLFEFEGDLFYRKAGEGLIQLDNGLARLRIPESRIGDTVFLGMAPVGEDTLLIAEDGTFYFIRDSGLEEWSPPGLRRYPSVRLYSFLQPKDGRLVLGTISQGVVILDPQGNLLQATGKREGLNNNTVLALFEDRDQNLWLALDNGISVINSGSAFREYIDEEGNLGVVYAAQEFQNRLYLGTNQGLFQSPRSNPGRFTLVPGTEGQVWSLRVFGDALLCGHDSGTFRIEGDRAERISDIPGTWDIKRVPGRDSLLIQGGYQGLSVLERTTSGWQFRNQLENFRISSRFFEFTESGRLIVNHEYKGVYDLQIDAEYRRVIEREQTPAFGYGASLFRFTDTLYYANSSGMFRFDEGKRSFVADTFMNARLFSGSDVPRGVLIAEDNPQRLWGLGDRTIFVLMPDAIGQGMVTRTIDVPEGFRGSLGVAGFECIAPLSDGRYLIGRTDGYLLLDLEKLPQEIPPVALHGVTQYFYDNQPAQPVSLLAEEPAFRFREGNLNFTYGVPLYGKYREVQYQYWLEGLQETWGGWSTATEAGFDNLPYGDYTFHVRARIGSIHAPGEATFGFSVLRPWYLSYWALALFGLIAASLGYLIHYRYKAYYRKQQAVLEARNRKKMKRKKLKARKKMVEMRNQHLQKEIDSKNRELAVSTMSLIRKNEFLSQIKEQLREARGEKAVDAVIRNIDRNINNEEDWAFFEKAFKNADKDFLKNIKEQHPELTPNDLKLCAYLRLNLSSKEIAPLLNISVRSVEVKRYRLRKKMQLEHEQGLTDYILQL